MMLVVFGKFNIIVSLLGEVKKCWDCGNIYISGVILEWIV